MKERCPWLNLKNPLYIQYHDREWGRPIREENLLFECLTLEGAQAGLSWETVLNKRENYRKLFKNFDPKKVAKFDQDKIQELLENPGIIRNKLKVHSTVTNAQNFLKVQKEFGSFSQYIWSFTQGKILYNQFKRLEDYPSKTELSDQISKDLAKRGFKFVGSTIIYAFLQAVGIVQDHSTNCYLHGKKLNRLE